MGLKILNKNMERSRDTNNRNVWSDSKNEIPQHHNGHKPNRTKKMKNQEIRNM